MNDVALLVIAKDPRPGRVKTRLCPPCTPDQAARLAEAALLDTLAVVAHTPAARKVLVLDGDGTRWHGHGLEIVGQRGTLLSDRLAHAFAEIDGPALLVGMDTPQLTAELLREGIEALSRFDAVLGPAPDGGYWSVGLRRSHSRAFRDVPMSTAGTLRCQRERFRSLGLATYEQAALRDVDTMTDAHEVARGAPHSRFARALAAMT